MSIYTLDLTTYKQEFDVSKEDKLEYGEIYTPFSLINQMLNLFEPSVFMDPEKTWLDVGAGRGYISMVLFDRLNQGLREILPDETARITHILTRMLFMVELKDANISALKSTFGENANILHTDFCSYDFATHDFATHSFVSQHSFDYIIGNPPYNTKGMKKVPTNKVRDKHKDGQTSWALFIRKSLVLLKPETGKLCMIIPSLWLKPDKSQNHQLLTSYKIEKLHCLSGNQTNTLFKGAAQTPTCFFLLTNQPTDHKMDIFDMKRQSYVTFSHTVGQPIPVFGATIVNKIQPWVKRVGGLNVKKTNMPPINSKFTEKLYVDTEYPFMNIITCVLEGLQPVLLLNYSNIPQSFHGVKKLILAHKMYGFPYFDNNGIYGISNRDNYVILDKTDAEFKQLQVFLSTKFALYLFEATRYRMKYLEKYAFNLIPDITKLTDFPQAADINDETVAAYFGLAAADKEDIQSLHRKNYKRFI